MITVKGKAVKIKKENYKCPKDGIHRRKESGRIRGFWGLKLSDVNIYYGNWAYYFPGYKVFYSFKFNKTTKSMDEVKKTASMMRLLKEFCPVVHTVDNVVTDIVFDKRKCKAVSPALLMQHVYYPEKAWLNFARGKPYDWNADGHPAHSIVGFEAFRNELELVTKNIQYAWDSFSIGNIVWCTQMKRWYLVDVR
jgi:hypothetical protein